MMSDVSGLYVFNNDCSAGVIPWTSSFSKPDPVDKILPFNFSIKVSNPMSLWMRLLLYFKQPEKRQAQQYFHKINIEQPHRK